MIRPFSTFLILVFINAATGSQSNAQGNTIQNRNRTNILYIDINNTIEINVPDVPTSKLNVRYYSEKVKGEIHKDANGKYIATVSGPGSCRIDIYNGQTLVKFRVYECKYSCVGLPALSSGYIGGNIQPEKIKTQAGIVILENPGLLYRIKGFTMTYRTKDGVAISTTNGAEFNDKMKSYISRAKVGDSYIIDDIIVVDTAGDPQKLHNLTFSIL